jgi:hypothetical protein
MPTSGTREGGSCGGGQSAVELPRLPSHRPAAPGGRAATSCLGLGSFGTKGRRGTARDGWGDVALRSAKPKCAEELGT